MKALVVTPVKDSLETTQKTIEAVSKAQGDFEYLVFNDFSNPETKTYLEKQKDIYHYRLINIEEVTATPSPNYKLVLRMGQQMALAKQVPLILVESDVIIGENSIEELLYTASQVRKPGLVGMITVDREGNYNFPYAYYRKDSKVWTETTRSLSFCCTLMSPEFLHCYDFRELSPGKDWFDIHISRQSRNLGFHNYLIKKPGVLHLPHSSRPWKQLKYTNPLRYYFFKLMHHRDRI